MKLRILTAIFAATLLASPQLSPAQDVHSEHDHAAHNQAGHSHATAATGPHGGTLQAVGDRRVETVIADEGIMFMILGKNDRSPRPTRPAR
jgi:hypothetical protein